jgi:hypothetical protein
MLSLWIPTSWDIKNTAEEEHRAAWDVMEEAVKEWLKQRAKETVC